MSYKKLYNYKDFASFLDQNGYLETAKKKKEALDLSLEGQLSDYNAQKEKINASSDELAREAYVSFLATKKEMPEALAVSGMNGGAADNVYLSLANEYMKNYGDIAKGREDKLYQTDVEINKAKANNKKEYADALATILSKATDNYHNYKENAEDRNLESYYKDAALKGDEADRKLQTEKYNWEKLMETAKLAFEAGDESFLEKLGITSNTPNYGNGGNTDGNGGSTDGSGSGTANSGTSVSPEDAADLQKLLDYAVSLAEYGNFDLFCSITGMSKEDAAIEFADPESKLTEKEIRDAAKLFMMGDRSPGVMKLIKDAYPNYTYDQIWRLWEDVARYEWYLY